MSFLSGIKNFIKTEVLGIEEVKPKTQNAQQDTSPVIECETEKPEDKYVKGHVSEKTVQNNRMSRKAMEASINNIPAQEVNIKNMLKNGLIEKITGLTKEEFDKLTPRQQAHVISAVQYTIAKYESLKAQGKISADGNLEEIIAASGNVVYEAIENGDFENTNEFDKAVGDIAAELGKDFNKRPNKEQRGILKERRLAAEAKLQEELESIKNLPEEQRAKAEERIQRRYRHVLRGRFIDVSAQMGSESGVNAIILLKSKDMAFGAKTLLNTRCTQEEATRTADYADYEFTKGLIKDYKEIGDNVEAETLQSYTQIFMEYKSAEAVTEYQENYKADRNNYEAALRKQKNGEALTEEEKELLATMSTEYYTATAKGIGQGALNNVNMTNDQKAEFLACWEEDAKQYSDYHQVVKDVKKEIETNPEHKDIKAKIEEIQTEKTAAKKSTIKPTITISREETKYINKNIAATPKPEIKKEPSKKRVSTSNISIVTNPSAELKTTNSNPIVIAQHIKSNGIHDAIKTYGSDAIQVILDDTSLQHLRSKLTTIIRSYDLNTLKDVTTTCSDSSFVYICSVVNKDFIPQLTQNREHTKGLCYAADKQVKNIEGEYESV